MNTLQVFPPGSRMVTPVLGSSKTFDGLATVGADLAF